MGGYDQGMGMGAGGYPPQAPQGRMANPQQQGGGYGGQYQNDEYGEGRGNYNDQMNMRNMGGPPAAPGMRGPVHNRGGQMGNNRYPMDNAGGDYYEDEYDDGMHMMGNQMNGPRGGMGYDQSYDDYDSQVPGYNRTQGPYRNDYQGGQYGNGQQQGAAGAGMGQYQGMGMGALMQEPFTVEGSINSQTFDRKPGFDRSRKKVHTRERLRSNMPKNKPEVKPAKKKSDSKTPNGGDESDRMIDRPPAHQDGAKEPKRENIDSDLEDDEHNNSRAFLEEEISSESNPRQNSQGSLEDQEENLSEDGNKEK